MISTPHGSIPQGGCLGKNPPAATKLPHEKHGAHLRALREQKVGLSRAKVEAAIGISGTVLQRYENGERSLDLEWARKLAELYGVSLEELLTPPGVPRETDGALAAPQIFGANVARIRKARDLSVQQLADRTGFKTKRALEQLEAGDSTRAQREEYLPKFEAVLNASRSDLLALPSASDEPSQPHVDDTRFAASTLAEISYELRKLSDRAKSIEHDLLTRNRTR